MDHPVRAFSCAILQPNADSVSGSDNKIITLEYADGSIGTIHYFSVGARELGKEWMEVHFDEKTIVLDDYKSLKGYGVKTAELKSKAADKGLYDEMIFISDCIGGRNDRANLGNIFETTWLSLLANSQEFQK